VPPVVRAAAFDATYHQVANVIVSPVYLGLSSYIFGDRSFSDFSSEALPAQIQAHMEFLFFWKIVVSL